MKYALALLALAAPLQAQVMRQNFGVDAISVSSAAATYVNKTGDTMTGALTVNANVISGSSITTTGGLFGNSLTLTGGRLTQTFSTAGQYAVTFNSNATNSFGVKINGGTTSAQYALLVNDSDDVDTLLAVQGGGNVGLGTTSPASKLEVLSATGNNVVASSTTASGFGVFHAYGTSGGCLMIQDTDNAGWTECKALNGTLSCGVDADGVCD